MVACFSGPRVARRVVHGVGVSREWYNERGATFLAIRMSCLIVELHPHVQAKLPPPGLCFAPVSQPDARAPAEGVLILSVDMYKTDSSLTASLEDLYISSMISNPRDLRLNSITSLNLSS